MTVFQSNFRLTSNIERKVFRVPQATNFFLSMFLSLPLHSSLRNVCSSFMVNNPKLGIKVSTCYQDWRVSFWSIFSLDSHNNLVSGN